MKADLTSQFEHFLQTSQISNAEANWLFIKSLLLNLMKKYIPTKDYPLVNKYPWVNRHLKNMLNSKRKVHARAKRTNSIRDWDEFRRIRNNCLILDKQLFNEFISNSLDDGNHSKSFWRYLKSKKQDCGVPPVKDRDGNLCTDASAKSDLFNHYFHSVFTHDSDNSNISVPNVNPLNNISQMEDLVVDVNGIKLHLSKIKESKAAGPDCIPGRVLKSVADELAPYLAILFQQVIDTGQIPCDWKEALVVPIFKNGNKNSTENYRPVSLTSLICKVFEHILYSNIIHHLISNNILASEQHGFSKNLSCETQATALLYDLCKSMDDKIRLT